MRHPVVLATTLFSILLALCGGAPALDPSLDVSQYAHTAWKVREGFTKGPIISIAQTPDGYLWLGTELGLYRFDGVRNVLWQPPRDEQLLSNAIYGLLAARNGTLWIGTANGLASWKGGKLTQYLELNGQYVFGIVEDHEGTIWAGGTSANIGKLCAIRNGNVQCYGEDGTLGHGVFDLYQDSKDNIWLGVKDGIWRWRPGPPRFYPLAGEHNGIQGLAEDTDGTLLVGWKGGIRRFNNGRTVVRPLPRTVPAFETHRLLRDRDGGLWIGTSFQGLVHAHQGRIDVFTKTDGLSGNDIQALFQDREGTIWVVTFDGGLDRFRDFAVATFTLKQGLSRDVVGSVLAAKDGSVWLGTYGGLNQWKNGEITTSRTGSGRPDGKLNGQVPQSLFQDARGRLWVSTYNEFGYLENEHFVSLARLHEGTVLSIVEDSSGDLWVDQEHEGLFHISHGSVVKKFTWSSLGHEDHISVLAADPLEGGLWLGFHKGGVAYLKDGQVRAKYASKDGLGENRVNDFRVEHDGTLWASTHGGLSRLKNGRIATLNTRNSLPCDAVHWMVEDNAGSFWLYTDCGLLRIAGRELEAWAAEVDKGIAPTPPLHLTVFDSSDGVGILSDPGHFHPQVAKSADGKLWFLPEDGISVVDPAHLPFNKLPPPLHIEQIIADHKTYDSTADANGQVRLPPRIRDLQIDYTALSLVAPEKVLFRYKLEGWDRDWQDAGTRRQAFYSNLPPRNYTFRVKACNNSGLWNEDGASLDFSIATAYYQTWWFRSLCVIVFLALLWALYRWRIHQLKVQETRMRDAVETIPAMTFTASSDGSCTFVNKGWTDYTGLSVGETLGTGWQHAIHPGDLVRHSEKWRISVATGQPFEDEARFRRAADGEYRSFLVRGVSHRDSHGKIIRWYGTLTDIEDRKRAEEVLKLLSDDLQDSKAKLEEAQRITHVGYWEQDLVTGRIMWSDETYRIFGLQPQEHPMDLAALWEKIHPEDRELVSRAIEEAVAGGARYDVEYRLLRPTGEVRIVHSNGDVKRDESGGPCRMFGTVQDITYRKCAEEALRLSESYLEQAQRLAHVGSYAYQMPEKKALYLSTEWYRMYGFDPKDGAPTWEQRLQRVHPEDRARFKETVDRATAEKSSYDMEFRIVPPHAPIRFMHSVGEPVISPSGELLQYVGVMTDITARKHAEQEREKLRQLEDDLAHINRVSMLGEMAASLAHEIKQPIAAAINSANSCIEWLAHEPPNLDRARASATKINKYGNRASEIIDRIRSLYKKSPSQRELVDVNGIIQEMLTLLKGEADRYSVTMRTELSAELPKIIADRVQLQQVFMNLMLNAIEAMKDSGGELTVKSQLQDGQLQFSVSDTGVGLPTEKVDQIFSAFYTTKPQGSGIGLAISRSIVESHGGRLWATANQGRGATLHFTLLTEAAEPAHHVA